MHFTVLGRHFDSQRALGPHFFEVFPGLDPIGPVLAPPWAPGPSLGTLLDPLGFILVLFGEHFRHFWGQNSWAFRWGPAAGGEALRIRRARQSLRAGVLNPFLNYQFLIILTRGVRPLPPADQKSSFF